MKKVWLRWVIAVMLVAVISGCGDGGDSVTSNYNGTTKEPVVNNDNNNGNKNNEAVSGNKTGVFLDSKVEGVRYETSSGVRGVTNAGGEYEYNEGDTVQFYLGDMELGKVKAQDVITVFDLKNKEEVATLLQNLDDDGNPRNGIHITKEMRDRFYNSKFSLSRTISPDMVRILDVYQLSGMRSLSEDEDKIKLFVMIGQCNNLNGSIFEIDKKCPIFSIESERINKPLFGSG